MNSRIVQSDFYLWLVVATLSVLTACTPETEVQRMGAALLEPSVAVDATVTTVNGAVQSDGLGLVPAESECGFRLVSDDGRYSKTWSSVNDYPLSEPLRPGAYLAEAFYGSEYGEGFDSPYYYGSRRLSLASGEKVPLEIKCSLANTMMIVEYSEAIRRCFDKVEAILHADGGNYISYPADERRAVYVHSGKLTLNLSIGLPSGESAMFEAAVIPEARPGYLYKAFLDAVVADDGVLNVLISFDELSTVDDILLPITDELLSGEAPIVSALGFQPGTPLAIDEGSTPDAEVGFEVDGEVSVLKLSTVSPGLLALGWPAEIDLASATDRQLQELAGLGLSVSAADAGRKHTVDLTGVLSRLRCSGNDGACDRFILQAKNAAGKISDPMVLDVDVRQVDLSVVGFSDVMMGLDIAQIRVLAPHGDVKSNLTVEALDADGVWRSMDITGIDSCGENEYAVNFMVPEGTSSSVTVRVLYCGREKARIEMKRVSPEFTVDVDAYAFVAAIKIVPAHDDMLGVITANAKIYVNGERNLLLHRDMDTGIILVGGLKSNTTYSIGVTMVDEPSAGDFVQTVKVATENDADVPGGDFEDVKDGIKYENMPSGGRYSQNIVDIYNQQNYTSYDLLEPKGWANTNAKTFCTSAKRHNTWYMQPSVYSSMDAAQGDYAVVIRSTAWDIDGQAIPDYRQEGNPYVNYSRNIPEISNRAAGKIFLGEYRFNSATQTEYYEEGVAFGSRPAALNGFYKFIPSPNALSDQGLVRVEVQGVVNGTQTVIAYAQLRLTAAISYTAFSVPLTYDKFGVKANKIKIMLASSQNVGDIGYESANVVTYSNASTATSLGGELWVDGLSFSY